MILILVISLLLIVLAGIANAVMDTLAHHYSTSIFAKLNPLFWNPTQSWKNKYKNGDPKQGPKFWGSTTFFVAFTDGWHLFKLFMLSAFQMAVALPLWFLLGLHWIYLVALFFGFKMLFSIGFNPFYDKFLITKNKSNNKSLS